MYTTARIPYGHNGRSPRLPSGSGWERVRRQSWRSRLRPWPSCSLRGVHWPLFGQLPLPVFICTGTVYPLRPPLHTHRPPGDTDCSGMPAMFSQTGYVTNWKKGHWHFMGVLFFYVKTMTLQSDCSESSEEELSCLSVRGAWCLGRVWSLYASANIACVTFEHNRLLKKTW